MVSGKSFGRAIRERFGDGTDKVPKIGYFVAIGVFIGNTVGCVAAFWGIAAALGVGLIVHPPLPPRGEVGDARCTSRVVR